MDLIAMDLKAIWEMSDKSACTGYGFTLGTSEHAKCVQAQSMAAQKKTDCMLSSASSAIRNTTTPTSSIGQIIGSMGQAVSGC